MAFWKTLFQFLNFRDQEPLDHVSFLKHVFLPGKKHLRQLQRVEKSLDFPEVCFPGGKKRLRQLRRVEKSLDLVPGPVSGYQKPVWGGFPAVAAVHRSRKVGFGYRDGFLDTRKVGFGYRDGFLDTRIPPDTTWIGPQRGGKRLKPAKSFKFYF